MTSSALPVLRGRTHFVCPLGHIVVETVFNTEESWGHWNSHEFERGRCEYGFVFMDDCSIEAASMLAFEVYDDEL